MLQNPLITTNTAGRWVAVLVLMFVTAASNMGYAEVSSASNIHSAGMVVTNANPPQ